MYYPNPCRIGKVGIATVLSSVVLLSLVKESIQEPYPVFMGMNIRQRAEALEELE